MQCKFGKSKTNHLSLIYAIFLNCMVLYTVEPHCKEVSCYNKVILRVPALILVNGQFREPDPTTSLFHNKAIHVPLYSNDKVTD